MQHMHHKSSKGMVVGILLGAAAAAFVMSDGRTRRKMLKNGKHAMRKAEYFMDDMKNMF